MKRIILLFIVAGTAIYVSAQGSCKIMPGTTIKTINGAHFVLNNMSLINNGTIQQATNAGNFDFRGNTNDTISGTGITIFDRINLAKNSGSLLTLRRNVIVNSQFVFTGGLLNLDNYILDLGNQGFLINESEVARAYTTGTGYIQAAGVLNNPSSVNLGNLGAVISSTKNFGSTIIRRGHEVQQNVYGTNSSIRRYFDILPTNNINLKATLKFYYFNSELNGINEATLIQWKKKNANNWDYVGADSKDAVTNYVLRNNISKFAQWTLAMDTVPPVPLVMKKVDAVEIYKDEFVVKVMPNPTNRFFTITAQSADQKTLINLKVINVNGQIIEPPNTITTGQTLQFGENYRPGVYFVEVLKGANRKVIKLVKQ